MPESYETQKYKSKQRGNPANTPEGVCRTKEHRRAAKRERREAGAEVRHKVRAAEVTHSIPLDAGVRHKAGETFWERVEAALFPKSHAAALAKKAKAEREAEAAKKE